MQDMNLDDAIAIIKQRIIDLETMNKTLREDNKMLKDTVLDLVQERNLKIQNFEADAWSEGYEAGGIDARNGSYGPNYPRKNPYRSK